MTIPEAKPLAMSPTKMANEIFAKQEDHPHTEFGDYAVAFDRDHYFAVRDQFTGG